jgi:TRAP-type C4-dicarboxylate transport system substrate-binding protein
MSKPRIQIRISIAAVGVLLTISAPVARAQAEAPRVVLKLGTAAPAGSSFHKILKNMGGEWAATAGGAELRIYPGGIAGGEADMVRKMRIGQLDAALITANGLAEIDPAVKSLQSVPMLYQSLDEVDFIADKLGPRMSKRLREKGFVVLFWLDMGWVRFFSKQPIRRPDDLKVAKLFTWAGDTGTFDTYRSAGFHPVALETNDALPMLRTGMITALPAPPFVALINQAYTIAPNMLQLDWAPLVGALVVTEKAWNKLAPSAQAEMARIAFKSGTQMRTENRAESDASVEAMKKRGLKIYAPSADEIREWRRIAEKAYPQIRGSVVPADAFDDVQKLLASYRVPPKSH